MRDDYIRDIPKHKKAIDETRALIAILKVARFLSPVMPASMRKAVRKVDMAEIQAIRDQMDRLANLPDRFNQQFADRGWVMFEAMNADVADEATSMAERGSVDEAEDYLANFWTTDQIRHHITQLKRVEAFRSRWRLAVDAETLYGQELYHACVLMVLAVLDGMVQETSARFLGINQNFSAEKTDLEAWNSIAGHSTGLSKLKQVMLRPRKKTNLEAITIPYRHGVIHGMDVNFNSRLVAAKTWAAIFAVGEWAYLAQQGALFQPVSEEPKSLVREIREIAEQQAKNEELKAAIDSFKPRDDWEQGLIPTTGQPEDYRIGTPERALVQFLVWWQNSNYGKMAGSITTIGSRPTHPLQMRDCFNGKTLCSFEITEVRDGAIARSTISVRLNVRGQRDEWTHTLDVAMIKFVQANTPEDFERVEWTFSDYYQLARRPKEN
ncbi:MAG: hypothetical protein AAGJ10_20050 [Bacteroidota bacterium]